VALRQRLFAAETLGRIAGLGFQTLALDSKLSGPTLGRGTA
jgi:hypothetical protein